MKRKRDHVDRRDTSLRSYPQPAKRQRLSNDLFVGFVGKDPDFRVSFSGSVIPFGSYIGAIRPRAREDVSPVTLVVALQRSSLLANLRRVYGQLLTQHLANLAPPKESFNRWLMERSLHQIRSPASTTTTAPTTAAPPPDATDPVLPFTPSLPPSPLLHREISEDVPVKLCYKIRSVQEGAKDVDAFLSSTERFLHLEKTPPGIGIPFTDEQRKVIVDCLESAKAKRSGGVLVSVPDFEEILTSFKEVICPLFRVKLHGVVEQISRDLERVSIQYVQQLDQFSRSQSQPQAQAGGGLSVQVQVNQISADQYVVLAPAYQKQFRITGWHLNKLRRLYRGNSMQRWFNDHLFLLLLRYEDFFGNTRPFEGSGHQGAVPPKAMKVLADEFAVTMECFASPLNCYFGSFCSAFLDTDYIFGSVGSFFDIQPIEGSFEVNPPFVEEMMIAMGHRINQLIKSAEEVHDTPLSFIVIMPHWDDAESIINLKKSPYLRRLEILPAQQHSYVGGFQHREMRTRLMYRAVHETCLFFLQSLKAMEKWPIMEDAVERFRQSFI